MELPFNGGGYDLASPDGKLIEWFPLEEGSYHGKIEITGIASNFVGFDLPKETLQFNIKSTLAQLGVDGRLHSLEIERGKKGLISMSNFSPSVNGGKKCFPCSKKELTSGSFLPQMKEDG